jgi:hypothetical protein
MTLEERIAQLEKIVDELLRDKYQVLVDMGERDENYWESKRDELIQRP